jgi:N-acetylmuramoyl-L-alanine amidase
MMFPAKTKYFNERKSVIDMLLIHGTEVDDAKTRAILSAQTEYEVSCHYYIDDKGQITQYLDELLRAWHAGKGYWAGSEDMNSRSIGIELLAISNDGNFTGDETIYTDAQIESLAKLSKEIVTRHRINPAFVLGHTDTAPFRKFDPGPKFPWATLAEKGVGLWHGLQPKKNDVPADIQQIIEALTAFGYDTRDAALHGEVIKAFQTHFLPWNICGLATQQTLEAARILVDKKLKA